MNILTFDHFFWQDLDALESVLSTDDVLIRIPYQRWHRAARKAFPEDAFENLGRAYDADLAESWRRFRLFVNDEVKWLIAAYRPNVLVLPSDIFFYVRPFVEEFRSASVGVFVMQKETTISPDVMDHLSLEVAQFTPFMSDFMTVCSERHKQFWIRAGADPELVAVTGQPRFDVYAGSVEEKISQKPRLLYLTYDDVAYLPTEDGLIFEGTWRDLRLETETILSEFADLYDIRVKQHPQQVTGDTALSAGIVEVDRFADTRDLILNSDLVVGFQTTAIYEAVVCGKPVVYPAWGKTFDVVKRTLCRFEEIPGMINWATSGDHFRAILDVGLEGLSQSSKEGYEEALIHLGPIDGQASERTLKLLRDYAKNPRVVKIALSSYCRRSTTIFELPILWFISLILSGVAPHMSQRFARRREEKRQVCREILLNLGQRKGIVNGN